MAGRSRADFFKGGTTMGYGKELLLMTFRLQRVTPDTPGDLAYKRLGVILIANLACLLSLITCVT
jgi:hypothetical protein